MLNQRKRVPTLEEMVDRIKAAVDARQDPDFVIVARTGALAIEGLQASLNRAAAYGEAGADVIFPEAVTDLGQYGPFARAAGARILATITEFGATPLFDVDELRTGGVRS